MADAFLLFFTLFWSGLVLFFDGAMAHGVYQQFKSREFPRVTGTITQSEVKSHYTSKGGISYEAAIQYRFAVEGHNFTGSKLRLVGKTSRQANVIAAVNSHPVGSSASVYYNPVDPQESLLSPGVAGSDFMLMLLLTPFNMVMLGLWLWVGGSMRQRFLRPAGGGVKVLSENATTRIRLPQTTAAAGGLATTGGLGFVMTFVTGLSTGMEPSLPLVGSTLTLVYASGMAVYLWQRRKINSGIDDLILNESSRTLELPLTFGRQKRVTVAVAHIKSLSVETIEHRGSKGEISFTYAPTLVLPGLEPSIQKLADWSDRHKAEHFADWLRPRLGPGLASTPAVAMVGLHQPPSTRGRSESREEIGRDPNSKVDVTDGPNGREFYFPAARNPKTASLLTVFTLGWGALIWLMLHQHAPIFFPIFFGLSEVVLLWACLAMWFKSSRLIINGSGVTLQNRWLIVSRSRQFSGSDIACFETRPGMTSGGQVFHDLKLITRAEGPDRVARQVLAQPTAQLPLARLGIQKPSGITLATSIASKSEANWLVREMTQSLGRTGR